MIKDHYEGTVLSFSTLILLRLVSNAVVTCLIHSARGFCSVLFANLYATHRSNICHVGTSECSVTDCVVVVFSSMKSLGRYTLGS